MSEYKVAILMGSPNDRPKMEPAAETLAAFGVTADVHVMSAHRTPAKVADFVGRARAEGYAAIICGAGMAAHLAGAAAAHTTLPVVGVCSLAPAFSEASQVTVGVPVVLGMARFSFWPGRICSSASSEIS